MDSDNEGNMSENQPLLNPSVDKHTFTQTNYQRVGTTEYQPPMEKSVTERPVTPTNCQRVDTKEHQPPLEPSTTERSVTPTKSLMFPLGLFLYTCGATLGSTTINQFVNNYTITHGQHHNESDSLQMYNDSHISCSANISTSQNSAKKEAANWLMYFELSSYFLGLPVIIIAGIYSDFYGRRMFSLLPLFGATIQYIIIFGIVFFDLPIQYMFVAYAVFGVTGTHYVLHTTTASSVADTTDNGKSRSFHITMLYLYIGIGESLASIGGGFLIQHTGFAIPCAVCSGICFMSFLALCNTHETLTSKIKSEKPPFYKTFRRFFGFFNGEGLKKKSDRWKFIVILAAFFVVLSPMTASSVSTLYELGEPFCFSPEMLGYFGAVTNFIHQVIGLLVLKLLHFTLHDEAISTISLLSGVSYMSVLAFASSTWMIFLGKHGPIGGIILLLYPLMNVVIKSLILVNKFKSKCNIRLVST